VDDTERYPLGLRWEFLAKDPFQQGVYDGVEPPFGETVPVLLRVPYIDVPKPAFGTFDGEMSHEPLGRLWAETVRYPLVKAFVGTRRAKPAEQAANLRPGDQPDPGSAGPLFLALRDASATEAETKEVWQEISDRRATNMRKLARDLQAAGGLRRGLTVNEAGDVLWATNSSELYVLLTVERGWSTAHYERWLADAWCRLLLPPEPE
jgi:hypothetical protein